MTVNFHSNFIENKEERVSVLNNPSYLYDILPTPKHALDFKFDIPNSNTLKCKIKVEYGIIGKFKIPKEFNLTQEQIDNQPGMVFTEIITLSDYDIISNDNYFSESDFPHCQEIEDELVNVTTLSVKYNSTVLKEKLKDTEMPNYKIIEITEGFIRTAIKQLFFGGTGN